MAGYNQRQSLVNLLMMMMTATARHEFKSNTTFKNSKAYYLGEIYLESFLPVKEYLKDRVYWNRRKKQTYTITKVSKLCNL